MPISHMTVCLNRCLGRWHLIALKEDDMLSVMIIVARYGCMVMRNNGGKHEAIDGKAVRID